MKLFFSSCSKQLAVGHKTSWDHNQHFKPGFVLQQHNALVDLFDESDKYHQWREEIQEQHDQLAAKLEKKNATLAAVQVYYNSKFKGKFFFARRKKEMKKKFKVTLLGLRKEVVILEAELKCSNNKTFDTDLEFWTVLLL